MNSAVSGYAGKQLRVYLDEKEAKAEAIDFNVLRKYLGGVGYCTRILYDELEKGIDPLSPDNKLIFATGPLTSYRIPGGGSVSLCFKSPLTNAWGESRCGGDFGPDLRRAGYDFVIIEGKAREPVYLVINDDKVEFKPAGHLLGKMTSEKLGMIRGELNDPKISVMCIGPGGENLVKYATVMFDQRAAGRCGAGTVMGSKNLIGIAVKGSKEITAAQPNKLKEAVREAMGVLKDSEMAAGLKEHGTTGDMASNDAAGDWPTKNFHSNHWGKAEKMYDDFYDNYLIKNHGCYRGCPIACGRIAEVKEGKFKTPAHEGSEYESLSAFTAFILNDNLEAALHSTYLCNEYGIDTISTGAVIAFIMECYENGFIKNKDIGNMDLRWGNPDVLPELVKLIAKREGIGDVLAEGVRIAAQKLGKGTEKFAVHGKGLESPAHDPRSGKALAVTYGTANRGCCHIHPLEAMAYDSGKIEWGMVKFGVPDPNDVDRWDEIGKGKIVKILQDGLVLPDILNTCKFFNYSGITLDHQAKMLSAMTGWEIDGIELMKIGERVINLQRLFNMREGFGREDDMIHERLKRLPAFGIYKDETRCEIKNYESMLDEYYEARGWDLKTGKPTREKLAELEIESE